MSNGLPFSDEARGKLQEVSADIRKSLIVIAREIASRDRVDAVQSTHVNEARRLLAPQPQKQNRSLEFAKFIAGIFMGASMGGFVSVIVSGIPFDYFTVFVLAILLFIGFGSAWYGYR